MQRAAIPSCHNLPFSLARGVERTISRDRRVALQLIVNFGNPLEHHLGEFHRRNVGSFQQCRDFRKAGVMQWVAIC